MTRIKFTSGTIQKLADNYYTLRLFNADNKQVYAATLDGLTAAEYLNKYNNITLIK